MVRKEKLVYSGPIFKVYQWRQRMFDGSYKIFERIERPAGARIMAIMDGRIAIASESQPGRSQSFKGFLGGRVEEGEEPLEAAKRELLEEAGLKARKWKLISKFGMASSKIKFDLYFFGAVGCKKVAEQKLDSGERIRIEFVTFDRLLKMKNLREGPDFALFFEKLRNNPKLKKQFARALGLPY